MGCTHHWSTALARFELLAHSRPSHYSKSLKDYFVQRSDKMKQTPKNTNVDTATQEHSAADAASAPTKHARAVVSKPQQQKKSPRPSTPSPSTCKIFKLFVHL